MKTYSSSCGNSGRDMCHGKRQAAADECHHPGAATFDKINYQPSGLIGPGLHQRQQKATEAPKRLTVNKMMRLSATTRLMMTIGAVAVIILLLNPMAQQVAAQRDGGGEQDDDDFDDAGFDDSGYSSPQSRDAESSHHQPSEYSPANEDDLDDDDEVDESNAIAQIIAQQREQQRNQPLPQPQQHSFYEPASAVWTPVASQLPATRRVRSTGDIGAPSEENDIEQDLTSTNEHKRILSRHKRYAKKKKSYIGPVYTYVKTDKHAHYKWGVKHKVGKHYG